MRDYLLSGELLFVFTGYSLSDQHINEIVLNCMRQNNRLFVIVFFYRDADVENLYKSLFDISESPCIRADKSHNQRRVGRLAL